MIQKLSNTVVILTNTVVVFVNTDGILSNTVVILTLPRTFERDGLVLRDLLHVARPTAERNFSTCAGEKLSHRFHRFTQITMRRRILLQISQMGTD